MKVKRKKEKSKLTLEEIFKQLTPEKQSRWIRQASKVFPDRTESEIFACAAEIHDWWSNARVFDELRLHPEPFLRFYDSVDLSQAADRADPNREERVFTDDEERPLSEQELRSNAAIPVRLTRKDGHSGIVLDEAAVARELMIQGEYDSGAYVMFLYRTVNGGLSREEILGPFTGESAAQFKKMLRTPPPEPLRSKMLAALDNMISALLTDSANSSSSSVLPLPLHKSTSSAASVHNWPSAPKPRRLTSGERKLLKLARDERRKLEVGYSDREAKLEVKKIRNGLSNNFRRYSDHIKRWNSLFTNGGGPRRWSEETVDIEETRRSNNWAWSNGPAWTSRNHFKQTFPAVDIKTGIPIVDRQTGIPRMLSCYTLKPIRHEDDELFWGSKSSRAPAARGHVASPDENNAERESEAARLRRHDYMFSEGGHRRGFRIERDFRVAVRQEVERRERVRHSWGEPCGAGERGWTASWLNSLDRKRGRADAKEKQNIYQDGAKIDSVRTCITSVMVQGTSPIAEKFIPEVTPQTVWPKASRWPEPSRWQPRPVCERSIAHFTALPVESYRHYAAPLITTYILNGLKSIGSCS